MDQKEREENTFCKTTFIQNPCPILIDEKNIIILMCNRK